MPPCPLQDPDGRRLMDKKVLFAQALAAAIRGGRVNWDGECGQQEWKELFHLAQQHHVVSLILEAVYACPDFCCAEQSLWKREAMLRSAGQTARSAAFEEIYGALLRAGLQPVVMKGIVCRRLYPNPDHRISADEDLLLPMDQFSQAVTLLEEFDWKKLDLQASVDQDYEIGMVSPQGLLLELHKTLFSPDGAAVESCNLFFDRVHENAVPVDSFLTMCPHDHMLYLLLHAYKHMIHSGFGLRQVCDILLWAERYGVDIDWNGLWEQCSRVRCLKFAQTVFAVAREYLGFDPEKAKMGSLPENLPCRELMDDLLQAGAFGTATGSRVHSATITLQAVEADRSGKKTTLLRSLFPKREDLQGRYTYLRNHAWLLPLAWGCRLAGYAWENVFDGKDNSPVESVKLGESRKALLQKLDIMDERTP